MPTIPLPRGIYEKRPGSGIYWIRYHDFAGALHREKAGNLGNAKRLLTVRRGEKLAGKVPQVKVVHKPAAAPLKVSDLIDTAIKSTASHLAVRDLLTKF